MTFQQFHNTKVDTNVHVDTVEPLLRDSLKYCKATSELRTMNFDPISSKSIHFTSKRGKPLIAIKNFWSQSVCYREVPLYMQNVSLTTKHS